MSSHTKTKPASPSARHPSGVAREERINRASEKIRHQCNRLTDAQRERLLDKGMQLIYGGGNAHVRNTGRG